MADVVAGAKTAPDRITYASPGSGTVGHLAGELIARSAGIKLIHVPYKGASPALTDLLGGQVDLYLSTPQAAAGHIKSNAIHALAVTSAKRETALPQVPTLAEAGFAGLEITNWYGVLAPANTPPAIVSQLNAAIVKALKEPELREALSREGGEVLGGTPAQFAELLKSEQVKWAKVVRDSGAKVD
jgi:tripartite-type tricarboxylate transporter receptor subunit TctC